MRCQRNKTADLDLLAALSPRESGGTMAYEAGMYSIYIAFNCVQL